MSKRKSKPLRIHKIWQDDDFYISMCYSETRGKSIAPHIQIIAPRMGWQFCSCEDFTFNKSKEVGYVKHWYWAYRWDETQCKHLQAFDVRYVIPAERRREREEAKRFYQDQKFYREPRMAA